MDKLVDRLVKLLDIKSIITIMVAVVFTYLAIKQILPVDKVMEITLLVFTFYFAYKVNKEE